MGYRPCKYTLQYHHTKMSLRIMEDNALKQQTVQSCTKSLREHQNIYI